MTSRPSDVRESGETQLDEVVKAESDANDEVDSSVEDPARSDNSPMGIFQSTGLSRMKFSWGGEDAQVVAMAQSTVDERLRASFMDAYQIMHDLFIVVRKPMVDAQGEVIRDQHGWPQWERTASGGWVEDWTALNRSQKENFLFQITTRLFAWEMSAANAWGEAMFAKAAWEERFAIAYDAPVTGTIQDRTSKGRIAASEERYFGIFQTLYSRKADAIVRTMGLLAQRLKDTLDLG